MVKCQEYGLKWDPVVKPQVWAVDGGLEIHTYIKV